ncbi:unnamed protein product [Dibothriocephalus latus]|uniref:SGNH hydrolase-type esterase domain-containing protein n=1 Tax=Dibothriocephalus latus TaxID=60516 RepID=A0A3P6QUQ4_DIBLA|nr:unnamed protein product [Dibothriocephalus latus]
MAADVPSQPEDPEGHGSWLSQHTRFVCQAKEREPDVLLIGDSVLSNFQHSYSYKQYIEPLHCLNFSIQNDQTQNVLWRILNGELDEIKVKVIVLAVGTHNKHSANEICAGIKKIIQVIKEKQPTAYIIVMVSQNYTTFNMYFL